jgi:hypothetical protein
VKVLLKIAGSIVVLLLVALVILRITGLNPVDKQPGRPGLWLSGHLVTTPVADWSFTDKDFTVHIQTHTAYLLPHSIPAYCSTLNGHLYVGSSQPPVRRWDTEVAADPRVRLGIEDQLYDVTLVPVTGAEYDAALAARLKKYPKYKMRPGTKFVLFRAEQNITTSSTTN